MLNVSKGESALWVRPSFHVSEIQQNQINWFLEKIVLLLKQMVFPSWGACTSLAMKTIGP